MKKMLFSAIAMVAFSITSSAQTSTVSLVTTSDKADCEKKASEYVNDKKLSGEQAVTQRKAFYDGCIAGKNRVTNTKTLNP